MKKNSRGSRILIFDCESAPQEAFIWQRWDTNVSLEQVIKRTHLLCWSAKWLNDGDSYYSDSLHNYDGWKKDMENDFNITESAWEMFNEADVVVAHNGDRFDIPLLNARFLIHGMQPPSPFKTIDTCKIAKSKFRFDANKLEEIATVLKLGHKKDTGGFKLWKDCKAGDEKAFDLMLEYCENDVFLLEKVYKKLAPWYSQHHNVFIEDNEKNSVCNVCGSDKIKLNGYYNTNTQIYRKYKCTDCGHNMRARKGEPSENKNNILRSL